MSNINDRLKIILSEMFDRNVSEFSRASDIPRPTLNNIVGNRMSNPSAENLEKLLNSIETIDANWLLTGKGEMLRDIGYSPEYNYNIIQHYTKADGLIGILKDMKLNFSIQERSNDIKERRLMEHDEAARTRRASRDEWLKKKDEIANYKWISFFIKDENREVKQPKMYDLYADFHKGGCIEFDKEKLLEKNKDLNLDSCIIKYEPYFLNQKETVREELKYKYYQWKDENELRLIYQGEKCNIDIEGSIKRIYLGHDFFENKLNVAEFASIIEKKNIELSIIAQIDIKGICILGEHLPEKNSLGVTQNAGLHIPLLLPYISEEYRKKYNIADDVEYIKINYKEEKYYKNKYLEQSAKMNEILLESRDLFKENKELRTKIDATKDKTISLQEKIISLDEELGEIKNDLVAGVSDVVTVLTKTAL
ncbi:MAG: DUF2971 domain-containing protein [Bacteroidales bacterium]|nr:DUF2971 domain-containing protein [Bacteroidales bacterium]